MYQLKDFILDELTNYLVIRVITQKSKRLFGLIKIKEKYENYSFIANFDNVYFYNVNKKELVTDNVLKSQLEFWVIYYNEFYRNA